MSILIPEIERTRSRTYNSVPREWLTDTRLSSNARVALALMSGHQPGFELNPARLAREVGICRDTWAKVARELRRYGYLSSPIPVRNAAGRVAGSSNRLIDLHLDAEAVTEVTEVTDLGGDHRDPVPPDSGEVPPLNKNKPLNHKKFSRENTNEKPPVASRPVAQPPAPAVAKVIPTVDPPEENPTSEAPPKSRKRVRRYFKKHWDLAQDVALHHSAGSDPRQGYIIGITSVIEHGKRTYGLAPAECAALLKALPEASKLELDFHLTTPTPAAAAEVTVVDLAAVGAAVREAAGVQEGPVGAAMAACQRLTGRPGNARNWEIAFAELDWEPSDAQVAEAVEIVHARPGRLTLDEVVDVLADMSRYAMAS